MHELSADERRVIKQAWVDGYANNDWDADLLTDMLRRALLRRVRVSSDYVVAVFYEATQLGIDLFIATTPNDDSDSLTFLLHSDADRRLMQWWRN